MEYNFVRKVKEKDPVLAICYDFDKTLSPDDMQAQGYIQAMGSNVEDFWQVSNDLAMKNGMDANLAYMYLMLHRVYGKQYIIREVLEEYGSQVRLFNGVETWFDRINEYGKAHGVIVEHYIISSGLKEMIEGTSIAKRGVFSGVYASSFLYDKSGVAVWPAQAVNYTNKTQFLFRIEKGMLDVNDQGINDYFPVSEFRVPFRNIVYIGDSATDIPCMKLVNVYGGHAIGVYNPANNNRAKVYRMLKDNRIRFFAAADYSEGKELDLLIKSIIDKTISYEKLENIHLVNEKEAFSS